MRNAKPTADAKTNLANVIKRLKSCDVEAKAILAKATLTARQRRRLTELSELADRLSARATALHKITHKRPQLRGLCF